MIPNCQTNNLTFTEFGAILTKNNGDAIAYKRVGGIFYHSATPDSVVTALEAARLRQARIRVYFGDSGSGRDWLEEMDVEGYVANSMGPLRVPLLVFSRRSLGGHALLDHCIVRVRTTRNNGRDLYRHSTYHTGTFSIRQIRSIDNSTAVDLLASGFTHAVDVDGRNHANFRSAEKAEQFVRRMTR